MYSRDDYQYFSIIILLYFTVYCPGGKYSDEARVSYDALLEHESEGEVAGANDLLTVSVADDVSSDEGQ